MKHFNIQIVASKAPVASNVYTTSLGGQCAKKVNVIFLWHTWQPRLAHWLKIKILKYVVK